MVELPAKTFTYRAFISYSHRDKQWGEWLHRILENYRVPSKIVGRETVHGPIPRRLAPIFRDRDELATADDLGHEITAALEASMFLLVMCSPAAAQSQWVNEEIKAFKKMHGEGRIRAVIVGGEPFSSDPQTECFP
ncbi:MAG: toll/interleukin-1 receptor domain-containing protein, partial [Marinicaulis sp.]|nr:toll/interleukin-1 receptor domain-containing protein [Marinicaulis sp.]